MAKENCASCKRPIAGESEWRSFTGWEGYPLRNESDYCTDPEACALARAAGKVFDAELRAMERLCAHFLQIGEPLGIAVADVFKPGVTVVDAGKKEGYCPHCAAPLSGGF